MRLASCLVLAVMLLSSACAPQLKPTPAPEIAPQTAPITLVDPSPVATPEMAARCMDDGGDWRPVCKSQKPMCVMAYKDAGKVCTDSDQCEGRCVAENDEARAGVCEADNDPCGCETVFTGGTPRMICVD